MQVLEEVGFEPNDDNTPPQRKADIKGNAKTLTARARKLSIKELEAEMQRAAENEDYKLAARLKKEIDSRNAQRDNNKDSNIENPDLTNTIL